MAKRSLTDQLNEAVEAIIAHPDSSFPPVDSRLDSLIRTARQLRSLPSEAFQKRLRADLIERSKTMQSITKSKVTFREGFHTVTPYIIVNEAAELIEFVKRAFGAEEKLRTTGSAGGIHCEVQIGDSMLMIGGGGAWRGKPNPAEIHLYVRDADTVYQSALESGASSIAPPMDQDYGDREAAVRDPAGNSWYIGTHQKGNYIREGMRSITPCLHPKGAPQLIAFLERALGAAEDFRYTAPDGTIAYATIRIGDSLIEMGEAHGQFQPMPTTFFLYVEDVDSLYARAIQAGATPMSEPADQPHGDRVAGVVDPMGNVWYLATPIQR